MTTRLFLFILQFFFLFPFLQAQSGEAIYRKYIHTADSIVSYYWGEFSTDYLDVDVQRSDFSLTTPSGNHIFQSIRYLEYDSIAKVDHAHFEYVIKHPLFATYQVYGGNTEMLYLERVTFLLDSAGKLTGENKGLVHMGDLRWTPFISKESAHDTVEKRNTYEGLYSGTFIVWWAFPAANGRDSIDAAGITVGRYAYGVAFSNFNPNAPRGTVMYTGYYYVDCLTGELLGKTVNLKKELMIPKPR
jgi:hypothetical protein